MKTSLAKEEAYEIGLEYKNKYNLVGEIKDINKSVILYEGFYKVDGPAWLVVLTLPTNSFEGMEENTIVISDIKGEVEYLMDHNGNPVYYHLTD